MGGVNGATDIVTNANPPSGNPDTVSSKEVKEVKKFEETKQTVDRSTTSNDSSKQSQGASNSCPIILATRPPLNLAKPAQPYAGETPKGPPSKKADADTTQTETGTSTSHPKDAPKDAVVDEKTKGANPQNGATGAADDDKPHREIEGQALGVLNRSSDGKYFGSLDVSESAVWKNKNFGPGAKLGSRDEVTTLHEPQGSVGVSLHMRDHDDATTKGGRPPAESTHVQVQGSIGIVNVTHKDDKGRDSVEGELDAVVGVDSYAGNNQLQGSLQLTVEKHLNDHLNDKASVVIQADIPVGNQPQAPSIGIGIKGRF